MRSYLAMANPRPESFIQSPSSSDRPAVLSSPQTPTMARAREVKMKYKRLQRCSPAISSTTRRLLLRKFSKGSEEADSASPIASSSMEAANPLLEVASMLRNRYCALRVDQDATLEWIVVSR